MKTIKRSTVLLLLALLAGSALAAGGYTVSRCAVSAGGRYTAAGPYVLGDTVGLPVVGHVGAGGYSLYAGFWKPAWPGPDSRPARVFLPAVMRGYASVIVLDDAPDNCPGQPVTAGVFYQDDFDAANDNDWFAFTAAAPATYTLRAQVIGPRADTILALYGPDCVTRLAENDDYRAGDPSSQLDVWLQAGTYHAMVRSYDWQVWGEDTRYWLLVTGYSSLVQEQSSSLAKSLPPATPAPWGER